MRNRLLCHLIPIVVLFVCFLAIPVAPAGAFQDTEDSGPLIQTVLDAGQYPVAPAFVRLLRISLEPGASSPVHTHPGPEIALVERGTITVQVGGPAFLIAAGTDRSNATPSAGELAPMNSDFEMTTGDQLTYLPQTSMTFRNGGSTTASVLTVVLLPAGHQHPPGVTYLNGQPDAKAFDGVTPHILGDGVASSMPVSGIRIVVDELRLDTGQAVPASSDPVMLSLVQGTLDFKVIGGKVQISRGATPGPQPDSAPGAEDQLSANDALFFPLGMKETPRAKDDAPVSFLRLTIMPAQPGAQSTPSEGAGEIQITGAESAPTATPENAPPAAGTPQTGSAQTPVASPSPTATKPAGPQKGDTVTVNSDNVNLRACAGTDCDIVTQLFAGQTVTIDGPPEDDGEYIWWPVSVDDDPSITGYIAQDFFDFSETNS